MEQENIFETPIIFVSVADEKIFTMEVSESTGMYKVCVVLVCVIYILVHWIPLCLDTNRPALIHRTLTKPTEKGQLCHTALHSG